MMKALVVGIVALILVGLCSSVRSADYDQHDRDQYGNSLVLWWPIEPPPPNIITLPNPDPDFDQPSVKSPPNKKPAPKALTTPEVPAPKVKG